MSESQHFVAGIGKDGKVSTEDMGQARSWKSLCIGNHSDSVPVKSAVIHCKYLLLYQKWNWGKRGKRDCLGAVCLSSRCTKGALLSMWTHFTTNVVLLGCIFLSPNSHVTVMCTNQVIKTANASINTVVTINLVPSSLHLHCFISYRFCSIKEVTYMQINMEKVLKNKNKSQHSRLLQPGHHQPHTLPLPFLPPHNFQIHTHSTECRSKFKNSNPTFFPKMWKWDRMGFLTFNHLHVEGSKCVFKKLTEKLIEVLFLWQFVII